MNVFIQQIADCKDLTNQLERVRTSDHDADL